jgi:hypothetical protein
MSDQETAGLNFRPEIELDALGLTPDEIDSIGARITTTGIGMSIFRQGIIDEKNLAHGTGEAPRADQDEQDTAEYAVGRQAGSILVEHERAKGL